MQQPLSKILLQWELDPPTLSPDKLTGPDRDALAMLDQHGLLCPAMQSGVAACDECGESRVVTFLRDHVTCTDVGYITCPRCGPTRLRREQLGRQKLDTEAMLRHLFIGYRLAVQPMVKDRLWQIGRTVIGGRSRECWFVRGLETKRFSEIERQLVNRPKTIFFTPSEAMARVWSKALPNMIISIESVLDRQSSLFQIDHESVAIRVLGIEEAVPPEPKPRPKRTVRLLNIELLADELKKHLRSAADYARSTADSDDGPLLLPRPTRQQLGQMAGLSKVNVTRCMQDEAANELRVLWKTADDLNAVLRLRSKPFR